ncbi:MAG: F0F1 ATP synthase subunit epsilon [Nevskia sp.]|nr:F0F1 ATP synthase subunit epsilon [Nevskia sp.]
MSTLHLTITSLGAVVVDTSEVVSLRAEDASGGFGVLPGHADFLTTLEIGVVSWRTAAGASHCAVRGGVLTVEDGRSVAIATREAIADADLDRLESTVLREFEARDEAERKARTESVRMELRAMREILRYLRPGSVRVE